VTGTRRARIGYYVAQSGAVLIAAGGVGDQFVDRYLPAHESFLGVRRGDLPASSEALFVAVLHGLGASLVAAGLACSVLLYLMRSTGRRWVGGVVAAIALLSDGVNAVLMWRVQSPFFVAPLAWVVFVVGGLLVCNVPDWGFARERVGGGGPAEPSAAADRGACSVSEARSSPSPRGC